MQDEPESSITIPIVGNDEPDFFYRFFHDSLYTDWVVFENGIDMDTVQGMFIMGGNSYTYNFSDLPNPAWVERVLYDDPDNYEECYLHAETLYCPSDTDFINWSVACPNSEF